MGLLSACSGFREQCVILLVYVGSIMSICFPIFCIFFVLNLLWIICPLLILKSVRIQSNFFISYLCSFLLNYIWQW